MVLDVVVALFALYMLVRYAPRAVAVVRGRATGSRATVIVTVLNVVLALAILAVAVKGLLTRLISGSGGPLP